MEPNLIFQILLNGLSLGALYALIAVGLTLVFGVLRIFNFAHGEFLMVGAFATWLLFGRTPLPFIVAAAGAMLFVGVMAVLIYQFLLKQTWVNPFNGFIVTLGIVYILQVSALLIFGPLDKPVPSFVSGSVQLWGGIISIPSLARTAISAGAMLSVWLILERTRFGRAVRASIQDNEAASLQGISPFTMCAATMFMAGVLAGLAGSLLGQTVSVGPYMGTLVALKAYIIVVVGGMASIPGTLVAALMFGFLDSAVSSLIDPRLSVLGGVVLMLVVLLIKPQGLFGHA